MDDKLRQFEELTDQPIGETRRDGPATAEPGPDPSRSPASDNSRGRGSQGLAARLRRDLAIVLTGTFRGVRYSGRDRAAILARYAVYVIGLSALVAFGFDLAGIQRGPVWTVQVIARDVILAGFAAVGTAGWMLLNNPLFTLAIAGAATVILHRR